jgi:signal transduction histidine kinase
MFSHCPERSGEKAVLTGISNAQYELASADLDTSTVMSLVVARARELTGASSATLEIVEDGQLLCSAAAGQTDVPVGSRASVAGDVAGRALASDKILVCGNSHHRQFATSPACDAHTTPSVMVVPLRHHGASIAVLKLSSPVQRDFDNSDVRTLRKLSGYAAAAISHALDYQRQASQQHCCEVALRTSEKMAMIGRNSAVVAHELTNPLEALTNILFLLHAHPTLDDKARDYVSLAEHELAAASSISKRVLGFTRDNATPVRVTINSVLDDALQLLASHVAGKKLNIAVRNRCSDQVETFPGELRQIFVNLLENAIDAAPPSGRIVIHTSSCCRKGKTHVKVAIADNGPGIRKEHQSRVFDPFFTTKGSTGTGIGLWVTRGLVEKYGGCIRFRSAPRYGTCFAVLLPTTLAP